MAWFDESQPQNIEAGQSRYRDCHTKRNVTPFPKAIYPGLMSPKDFELK